MSRPIRLAYLIPGLRIGGAERQMLELAERLPKDRFEVDFLDLIGDGPLDARARAAGLRIRALGAGPLGSTRLVTKVTGRVRKAAAYARVARENRYDIVDAWFYPEDHLVAWLRWVTRTPVIISGRRNMAQRGRPGAPQRWLERTLNHMTDAVVANSEAAASFAIHHQSADPRKMRVIRNGVEMSKPIGRDDRAALRANLGASDSDILLGCVANLREVKRHDLLIDAFAPLARERPGLRLVLVGEGPMRPSIERQVTHLGLDEQVRLHGSSGDARSMYPGFDIVVQASRTEGMPNALLEAASAGCAIVATAAGGTNEIVSDGVTGLSVPVDDRDALSLALARAVDDPPLRMRLGDAARAHVAAAFGMDRFVTEWVALYEGLAAAKGVAVGPMESHASHSAEQHP